MKDQNKLVAITGAGRGIGAACAQEFSTRGFEVLLIGRNESNLKKVQSTLKTRSHVGVCDLRSLESVKKLIEQFSEEFKSLVGLVNNAGIYSRKPFLETTDEMWMEQFNTNLFSHVRLTRELYPFLRVNKGSIVNISSTLGARPVQMTSAYSASKAALLNWTQSLALEFAPDGVRVNSISPGIIDTPLHSFTSETLESMADLQPLKRVGRPEEIAQSVFFIFSSPWTTGANLNVDGGISLT